MLVVASVVALAGLAKLLGVSVGTVLVPTSAADSGQSPSISELAEPI
jgi:hypothetical protein